jgi:CysZ protein
VPTALRFLRVHRSLWPVCVLPLLLNVALFAAAAWVFLAYLDALTGVLSAYLEVGDAEVWYQWIWVGPIQLLSWALRWILVLIFAFLVYFLFTMVGSVIAAPLLDLLSERVERVYTGSLAESESGFLANALRSLREEGKRVLFFVAVQLLILSFGLLPGMQPLAALGAFIFAALFLPLDYCGYVLDRRETPFRVRRAWLWENRRTFFGFGSTAFGTYLVPGLNFLCLPLLVTAGTILALDVGLPDKGTATGR